MNEDGTKVVYYTAAGKAGETVGEDVLNAATAKVELTMGKEKGVVGWSTTQDSNTPDASITFVAGDTYVYPVVKTGFWVTFDTKGGDYMAPQFRMEALNLSTVTPTRSGYTFTVGMTQTATRSQRFLQKRPLLHSGQKVPIHSIEFSIGRKMQMTTAIR